MNVTPTLTWKTGNASAMMWGCPTNWSPRGLDQEGDQSTRPELTELLGTLAQEYDLQKILSPNVSSFNSVFLDQTLNYPSELTLPRTACKIHRGLKGDGFEIRPGEAGIIAPADCAVIIVTTPSGRILMLHAGRDSLYDRQKIQTDTTCKEYESIIFAAWHELYRRNKEDAIGSKWHIMPSISPGEHFPHSFENKQWGRNNEKMITYLVRKYGHTSVVGRPSLGMINIVGIIATQLVEHCGINPEHITSVGQCTYNETDADGKYIWHSNARANHLGEDRTARNLVVVIHHK